MPLRLSIKLCVKPDSSAPGLAPALITDKSANVVGLISRHKCFIISDSNWNTPPVFPLAIKSNVFLSSKVISLKLNFLSPNLLIASLTIDKFFKPKISSFSNFKSPSISVISNAEQLIFLPLASSIHITGVKFSNG